MLTIDFQDSHIGESFYEQLRHSLSILGGKGKSEKIVDYQYNRKNGTAALILSGLQDLHLDKKHHIIAILTNVTVATYFSKWLEECLRESFYYEDKEEIQSIVETAKLIFFPGLETKMILLPFTFYQWQQEIYKQISPFIEEDISFSFDSLIAFRLLNAKEKLLDVVEIAIDEYKMELEYQSMVQRCRDVLKEQKSKVEAVYVHLKDGVEFYDEEKKKLSLQQIYKWLHAETAFEKSLPYQERMIGPLVSMAPNKIYLFAQDIEDDLYHTLRNIFEERIVLMNRWPFDFSDKKIRGL
ncbi:sporulation protein YtxC [Salipaludibacillus sp. CF4.18]|uniref:sporulation protein YtxC n=1 Tax=Salipaludibacillus sp. CF4.18 TaxID=3373081 RepID=UPI003EE694E8